MKITNKMHYID